MTLPVRLLSALAVLSICWATLAAHAGEMAPLPRKALPPDPSSGRVVVKFKDDTQWRKQILSARRSTTPGTSSATQVKALLAQRADALGSRVGVALQAGEAVSERAQVVTVPGVDGKRLAALLANDPEVEYAVPDGRSRALRVPNDPLYQPAPAPANGPASGQWYLKPPQAAQLTTGNEVLSAIDAQGAWDITTGHATTVVAVLDTGIRREHPDLANKVLAGYDMVSNDIDNDSGNGPDADPADPGDWITASDKATNLFKDCDVTDSSWHGTRVAGLVVAATDNATGMAGAGWNTRILPVRVLGKCFGYDSDIVKGMRWAAGLSVPGLPANPNPAKIINLSLGDEGNCTTLYQDAVNEVVAAGAVVIAAAGNTAGRAVNSPANCNGVIGVVGLRHIGTKVGFSDLGPEITIAAPGGNCVNLSGACLFPLLTTSNAGTTTPGASTYTTSFDYSVGTSFSAPLVSATVALMRTANRSLTPAQIRQALQSTARPFPTTGAPPDAETNAAVQQCHAPNTTDQLECYCTTSTCGAGMLDARAAVAQVARLEAYIDGPLASVPAGQAVSFGSSTVLAPGRSLASRQWSLVTPGAGITDLGGQDPGAATLSLTPTTDGSFVVQLVATDDAGATSSTQLSVTVGSGTPPSSDGGGGGGGGGALSDTWLAALALAVWLSRPRRRT